MSAADLPADAEKLFATARARAALAGIAMYQLTDDTGRPVYLLTKSHLTRELPDLAAVNAFLDRVDVHRG